MAQIVRQGDGFGQVFVQTQGAGDGAGDLRHFQRMRQAGAEMVFFGIDKDLRFVFQAAEGFGMQDAVAVALKGGADRIGGFGPNAALGQGRFGRPLGQTGDLPLFLPFTRRWRIPQR